MEPENIILAAAVAVAIGLYLWRAHETPSPNEDATLGAPSELPQSYEQQLSSGPAFYVAASPYYFAPPVSNVMPKGAASRTIPSGDVDGDAGCGCG